MWYKVSLVIFIMLCLCVGRIDAEIKTVYRFPVVPDSIIDMDGRVSYIVTHFWDDSPLEAMREPQTMETFFYAFSKTSQEVKRTAIRNLIDKCVVDTDLYSEVGYYMDFFIGTPESEYWDDDSYLYSQRYIVESPLPDEYKVAPRWRVDIISRTAIGTMAPDIPLRDSKGNMSSLYEQKMPCVIIFADSGCDRCRHEQIGHYDEMKRIGQFGWNIITVYLDGVIPSYADGPDNPSFSFMDVDRNILDNDIYMIRRLPSAYLLDNGKRIVAREIKIEDILSKIVNTD